MPSVLEKQIRAALGTRIVALIEACIARGRLTVPNDIGEWQPSPTPLLVSYQLSEVQSTCPNDGTQSFKLVWTPWNLSEKREEHAVTIYKRRNSELHRKPDEIDPGEDEVIVLRSFVAAHVVVFPGALEGTIFSDGAQRAGMIMNAYVRSNEHGGLVSISSRIIYGSQGKKLKQILWEINMGRDRMGKPIQTIERAHVEPLDE